MGIERDESAVSLLDHTAHLGGRLFGGAVPDGRLLLRMTLGYVFCKSCLKMVSMVPSDLCAPGELSRIVGYLVIIAVAYALNRDRSRRWLAFVPMACVVAASAVCLFCFYLGMGGGGLLAVATFLVYLNGAVVTVQWLELFGALPSKQVVLVLTATTFLEALLSLLSYAPVISTVVWGCFILVLEFAGGFLFWRCVHDPATTSLLNACKREVPKGKAARDFAQTLLWATVLGLTYALFTGSMDGEILGVTVYFIGQLFSCAILLACYLLLPRRFDMRMMLGIILPIVISSVASIGYVGPIPTAARLVFTTGESAAHILVFAILLTHASQLRTSAVLVCAVASIVDWCAHAAGACLDSAVAPLVGSSTLAFAALIIDSVFLSWLVIREIGHSAAIDELPGVKAGAVSAAIDKLGDEARLTAREKTVFEHMASGETNAEISSVLFISEGAVRSHASRIYEKLGVRSRREFDILVKSAAASDVGWE